MQLKQFSKMYNQLESCLTEEQLLFSDAYLAANNLNFDAPITNIRSDCLQQGATFNLNNHLFTFDSATMTMETIVQNGCNLILIDLLEDKLFSNGDASGGQGPITSKQNWRWCVWNTGGYQELTCDKKPCSDRIGQGDCGQPSKEIKDDGSDPSAGANDLNGAAGFDKQNNTFTIIKKSGALETDNLLPKELLQNFPCGKTDHQALFPKGNWAWIRHGPIGINLCTTNSGKVTAKQTATFNWWKKYVYDNGSNPGNFLITGSYLKYIRDNIDFTLLSKQNKDAYKIITTDSSFIAWGNSGHGMWGGNCIEPCLSLYWSELDNKFIINLQTGPRTWSGETVHYSGAGGYKGAIIPHGITLSGNDEHGILQDNFSIFNYDENNEPTLKDGIKLGTPGPGPGPGPGKKSLCKCGRSMGKSCDGDCSSITTVDGCNAAAGWGCTPTPS